MLLRRRRASRPASACSSLAAAGGVGTLLVQLASAAGATVVGAVEQRGQARASSSSLGADEVVDYTRDGWAVGPFDVVFDGVGGDIARAAFAQLAPGGRMLCYGLASRLLGGHQRRGGRGARRHARPA